MQKDRGAQGDVYYHITPFLRLGEMCCPLPVMLILEMAGEVGGCCAALPAPVHPLAQVFEEKQRRCEQELEGLRQRCAAQARQAAHAAHRGQQVLQLQVLQLQQEKKQLQEDLTQLLQERELLERRCASFQRERTELAPRLEETKWEVSQPAVPGTSGGAGCGWGVLAPEGQDPPAPEPHRPLRCARSQERSLC